MLFRSGGEGVKRKVKARIRWDADQAEGVGPVQRGSNEWERTRPEEPGV